MPKQNLAMKKLMGMIGIAILLAGCQDQSATSGPTEGSTNVGLKPGSGRVDTGGGVTTGDNPERVQSQVSGTATYERPATNTTVATNNPPR